MALVAFAIVLVFVSERWWVGTVVLYLPRTPLILPLLICLPLARHKHRRTVLAIQSVVAIALVLVLSGPHISFASGKSGGPSMRILSYNVWYGRVGVDAIEREVTPANADVIVFQASNDKVADYFRTKLGPGFSFDQSNEFFIASRYPILSKGTQRRRAGLFQYVIDTPLGPVDLVNMHPDSPRSGINELREESTRAIKGKPPEEGVEGVGAVESNTDRRQSQLDSIVAAASAATHPVIIAGDSNLPEWSVLYRQYLARWQDGFSAAGNGFGYTFPANKGLPWMRIDRVLVGPELRFTSFHIGGRGGSDHCAVWADIEKR